MSKFCVQKDSISSYAGILHNCNGLLKIAVIFTGFLQYCQNATVFVTVFWKTDHLRTRY